MADQSFGDFVNSQPAEAPVTTAKPSFAQFVGGGQSPSALLPQPQEAEQQATERARAYVEVATRPNLPPQPETPDSPIKQFFKGFYDPKVQGSLAEYLNRGIDTSAKGVEQFKQPGLANKAAGAHQVVQGLMESATPAIAATGVSAPLETGAALAAGTIGSKVSSAAVQKGLEKLGVSPEHAKAYGDVVGDLAGLVAAVGAGKGGAVLNEKLTGMLRTRFEASGQKTDISMPKERQNNVKTPSQTFTEFVTKEKPNAQTPKPQDAAKAARQPDQRAEPGSRPARPPVVQTEAAPQALVGPNKEYFRGDWNIPLNATGKAQATEAAQRSAGQFDTIISGTKGRHQETARAYAATNPQAGAVQTNAAFDPMHLGQHEGEEITPERLADLNHQILNKGKEPIPGVGKFSGSPGEAPNVWKDRLIGAVQDLKANWKPGQKTLVVTSGRDIQAIRAWAAKGMPADKSVDTSVLTAKWATDPAGLVRFDPGSGKIEDVQQASKDGIYFQRHPETDGNLNAAVPQEVQSAAVQPKGGAGDNSPQKQPQEPAGRNEPYSGQNDRDAEVLKAHGWRPYLSGVPGSPGASWTPQKFAVARWTHPDVKGIYTKAQALRRIVSSKATVAEQPTMEGTVAQGEVLYHGTPHEFRDFQQNELGIHFGTKAQAESRLATLKASEKGRLIRARIRGNPRFIEMPDLGSFNSLHETSQSLALQSILGRPYFLKMRSEWANLFEEVINKPNGSEQRQLADAKLLGFEQQQFAAIRAKLIAKGYAGIKYPNAHEGHGHSYSIFEPSKTLEILPSEPTAQHPSAAQPETPPPPPQPIPKSDGVPAEVGHTGRHERPTQELPNKSAVSGVTAGSPTPGDSQRGASVPGVRPEVPPQPVHPDADVPVRPPAPEPAGRPVAKTQQSAAQNQHVEVVEKPSPAPQPIPKSEGVYLGSGLGALEPLFREAKAEGDRLRMQRNDALQKAKEAEGTPREKKSGQAVRTYFTEERDLWAATANQYFDIVSRKTLPKLADREALSIAREFKRRPGELAQFIDGSHPYLAEGHDRGANLARLLPVMRNALRMIADPTGREQTSDRIFSRYAKQALDEGVAGGWLGSRWESDEYVPHILNRKGEGEVANLPSQRGHALGRIGKFFGMSMRRQDDYPTLVHAVADGLIPKTLDAAAAFTIHADTFARARATHLLEAHLAETGLGKWGVADRVPKGWEPLAPHSEEFKKIVPFLREHEPGTQAAADEVARLKLAALKAGTPHAQIAGPTPPAVVPDYAEQRLFVPPFIAKALRPITAPDYLVEEVPGFTQIRAGQRALKQAILGLSGFHLLTESDMATISMGPTGMYKALTHSLEDPETLRNERDGIGHGLNTTMTGNAISAYRSLQPGTIPTRAEVVMAYTGGKYVMQASDIMTRLTFDNVQRRFKVWDFALKRDAWINDNPHAAPEQLADAKRGIASYVNGVYGGLHWENMGLPRAFVEIGRFFFLAPDWSGSNIALAKYAVDARPALGELRTARLGGHPLEGAVTKESVQARLARAFWAKQMVQGLAENQLLSLMFSGKLSPRPFQVYHGNDKDGREVYQNVAFRGSSSDLISFWQKGPGVFLGSKAAPFTKMAIHQLTGRDDFGREIAKKDLSLPAKLVRNAASIVSDVSPIPIVVRSMTRSFTGDDSDKYLWSERIMTLFGPPAQHAAPEGMEFTHGELREKAQREPASFGQQVLENKAFQKRDEQ